MPNAVYEEMSIEDLEAFKQTLHDEEEDVRTRLVEANEALRMKILRANAARALEQAGFSLSGDGRVLLSPPPAIVGSETHLVGVPDAS